MDETRTAVQDCVAQDISDLQMLPINRYFPKSMLNLDEHYITKAKFPVIDAHTHFGRMMIGDGYESMYDMAETVERMKAHGIVKAVNLDILWGEALERMLKKTEGFEDYIVTYATVDVTRFEKPGFETMVYRDIKSLVDRGIRGLKFWKDIGLKIKDGHGQYLRPDDPRLDCIWQTAASLSLPVVFHIADPAAFFTPIDCYNERYEELHAHPDWAFNTPEFYSFDHLMQMQETLICRNPKTTFIIPHVGSCAEDLPRLSSWLDNYPNLYIDFADRIAELGRQPYSARRFFVKHQDRILFGTDMFPTSMERYPIVLRFLETLDEYFAYSSEPLPPQGRWNIYGIGLEDDVLKKIYHDNARRVLGL